MITTTTHVYLEDILNYPVTISMRNLRAFAQEWARVIGKRDNSYTFDFLRFLEERYVFDFLNFLEKDTGLLFLSDYQDTYARLVPSLNSQRPNRARTMRLLSTYIHPSFRPSVVMWKYCTKQEGKVVYETYLYGTMMHGQYLEQHITFPRVEQLQRANVPYLKLVEWINHLQPSDFNLFSDQPLECIHHSNVTNESRTEVVTLIAGDVTIRFIHSPETEELECSVMYNRDETQLGKTFSLLEELSFDLNHWTTF